MNGKIKIATKTGKIFDGIIDDDNFTALCEYFNGGVSKIRGIMFTYDGLEIYLFLDYIEYYIIG